MTKLYPMSMNGNDRSSWRGQYEISLSKIDEAIEHSPTVIDLYSVK
ncbi:N-alpha-acetyltransferase 15 NatA auxiliary subunit, partial [Trifolium medium]|nr:N-alpha-acetyltransferase 15 NatA auxiliary subunit [Trifolium medium]